MDNKTIDSCAFYSQKIKGAMEPRRHNLIYLQKEMLELIAQEIGNILGQTHKNNPTSWEKIAQYVNIVIKDLEGGKEWTGK